MKHVIVTKEVLELYDKYDGDFGLLHERWALEEDRTRFSPEQRRTLTEYVDTLYQVNVQALSAQMREGVLKRIAELEGSIDDEVIAILRRRIVSKK